MITGRLTNCERTLTISRFNEIGKDTLLYFDPSDPMDICKKMTEILLVGRKTYSRWPTWDKTALSIANLFENLMKY